tara:strand:+ start:218 stop:517 length:300 start_codon:yes stop_codon:yes gene_type:complete
MTSKTFFKLSILSAFLFVASCSSIPSKKVEAEQDTYDRGTLLDTISKMDAIANVLGCALAPASEDCKKFKKEETEETPHQTQKEYNEQSSKEWEEFDKE